MRLSLLSLLLLSACAAEVVKNDPDSALPVDAPTTDATNFATTRVYAHTWDTLFSIDPETFGVTEIGKFGDLGNPDAKSITDIAVTADGAMIGVSKKSVFSINTGTGQALKLSDFPGSGAFLTALSFVPHPTNKDEEMLIGADEDGTVYRIDAQTGQSDIVGNYGMGSSGDIVYIDKLGILATVKEVPGLPENNVALAKIDPLTFQATVLGDTGYECVFGIGFWQDSVYGFTCNGEFVLIDPVGGNGTLKQSFTHQWYGAGVTTKAPVDIE